MRKILEKYIDIDSLEIEDKSTENILWILLKADVGSKDLAYCMRSATIKLLKKCGALKEWDIFWKDLKRELSVAVDEMGTHFTELLVTWVKTAIQVIKIKEDKKK